MSGVEITVVIPTRDRADLLGRTVATVLAQRDVDFEVVVVDDGSRCGADVIAAVGGDPRVRVVRHERSVGVAAARNAGVAAARGRWVAFLDDDDLWAPRKLASQLAACDASGARWAYSGAVKFVDGPVVWQIMPPPTPAQVVLALPHRCLVPAGASNVLAERRTVLDVGGFDERLRHVADWDLWLRLLEVGPPAAAPGLDVGYRLHLGAMSLDPSGILAEVAAIDERYRSLRGDAPLDLARTHLWIGRSYLRTGPRGHAFVAALRAARTQPKQGLRDAARALVPVAPGPARHDHRVAAELADRIAGWEAASRLGRDTT